MKQSEAKQASSDLKVLTMAVSGQMTNELGIDELVPHLAHRGCNVRDRHARGELESI